MKKYKVLRISLYVFLLVLFAFGGFATFKYIANRPPEIEVQNAVKALSAAKKVGASEFAGKKFKEAESYFNLAMKAWKGQNDVFFLSRDFSRVKGYANQSVLLSNQALNEASIEKSTVSSKVVKQLADVGEEITYFETVYKDLPMSKSTFEKSSKARIKYNEASSNFSKGLIYEAGSQVNEAGRLIALANATARELLASFFGNYSVWQKNVRIAREWSEKGQTVILVNKMEATCSVLQAGKTVTTFKAEFGMNWMVDKSQMGDKATPEGIYHVTQKRNGRTRYYKSLLINYPNEEDKARFARLVRNGALSKRAKIGNLIEIHGNGGQGVHWTSGCIALRDSDMDRIFNLCSVGTPVIIIGSEKPMTEYFR
jgi:L,D-peptidoglycan transpeptidase YkuD (ErfK/YbiS/YcfS/YnhG family)